MEPSSDFWMNASELLMSRVTTSRSAWAQSKKHSNKIEFVETGHMFVYDFDTRGIKITEIVHYTCASNIPNTEFQQDNEGEFKHLQIYYHTKRSYMHSSWN